VMPELKALEAETLDTLFHQADQHARYERAFVSWCYRSEPDVLRSTSAKCRSFACSSRATRCARRLA